MQEVTLLKRIDGMEAEFMRDFKKYLQQVIHLPNIHSYQQISALQFWAPGRLGKILAPYIRDMFAMGRAHGDILCQQLFKQYDKKKLADGWEYSCYGKAIKLAGSGIMYDPVTFWLHPTQAIEALDAKTLILAGDVEADILSGVKQILLTHMNQGLTAVATQTAINNIMKSTYNRGQLICTTETTYAYNRGRLASYAMNDVDYVRFSAVMDMRTSVQCQSRHGLVMRMDSPQLAGNTPPLHGRCRSVLSPIYSKYEPQAITPQSTDWSRVSPIPKGWRMDGKSDILASEDVKHLEQAKKRDHKILITDIAISKVPMVAVNEFTSVQNASLQSEHKNVLRIAKDQNNSNEVLSICRVDFKDKVYVFGSENGVNPGTNPNAVALVRKSERQSLMYLHNHPGTSKFSLADINTFVTEAKIKIMSVVTNQGEVYILHKSEKYDYIKVTKLLRRLYEENIDIDDMQAVVANGFLKECEKVGVNYEKAK